jgi:hypothetical protein
VALLRALLQRRGEDISFAEFAKVQRQLEALQQQVVSGGVALQQIRERELGKLREALEALQQQVGARSGRSSLAAICAEIGRAKPAMLHIWPTAWLHWLRARGLRIQNCLPSIKPRAAHAPSRPCVTKHPALLWRASAMCRRAA